MRGIVYMVCMLRNFCECFSPRKFLTLNIYTQKIFNAKIFRSMVYINGMCSTFADINLATYSPIKVSGMAKSVCSVATRNGLCTDSPTPCGRMRYDMECVTKWRLCPQSHVCISTHTASYIDEPLLGLTPPIVIPSIIATNGFLYVPGEEKDVVEVK